MVTKIDLVNDLSVCAKKARHYIMNVKDEGERLLYYAESEKLDVFLQSVWDNVILRESNWYDHNSKCFNEGWDRNYDLYDERMKPIFIEIDLITIRLKVLNDFVRAEKLEFVKEKEKNRVIHELGYKNLVEKNTFCFKRMNLYLFEDFVNRMVK